MQYFRNYRRVTALLFHLVHKVIACNCELLLDNIAHGHEIFKALFQHGVYTYTI